MAFLACLRESKLRAAVMTRVLGGKTGTRTGNRPSRLNHPSGDPDLRNSPRVWKYSIDQRTALVDDLPRIGPTRLLRPKRKTAHRSRRPGADGCPALHGFFPTLQLPLVWNCLARGSAAAIASNVPWHRSAYSLDADGSAAPGHSRPFGIRCAHP
jgi:hypothetical protein